MPYILTAVQVPVPVVPSALLDPSVLTPLTSKALAAGDTTAVLSKFNENAVRPEVTARYGGGGYAIVRGLDLSAGAGLTLNIAAGQAQCDGPVTLNAASTLTLQASVRNHIYLSQGGAVTKVATSLTPPAGAQVYLGSVLCDGTGILSVDQSGVLYLRGGTLWRRTVDTTTPGDTPPASLQFFHVGAGTVLWWWDGVSYWQCSTTGASSVLSLALGGTEATGQLVLQPAGNVTLNATQADYGNIELRSGGGVAAPFTVTFPVVTEGREWTLSNTTGQTVTLIGDDGSECYLVNNARCGLLWDGVSLRRLYLSTPTHFNLVVTNPTYTFSTWDECDADYAEFTPSGGAVTVEYPNGGSLGKRGRRLAIKNDHTSQYIDIKTNGAGADKTYRLLPGETADFVIDDSGAIVRADTLSWTRRVSISYPSNADYTVVHPDFLGEVIEVATGSLASNKNLIMPTVDHKVWFIQNNTNRTITVKTSAGTGVAMVAGQGAWLRCDGTNIVAMTASAAKLGLSTGSTYTQTFATADRTHAARGTTALTDNTTGSVTTTLAALPDPADTPITADALRDDLVANLIPVLRNALATLAAQINLNRVDDQDSAQALNAVIDDLQSLALVS